MNSSKWDTAIGWTLVAVQAAFIAAVLLLPRRPAWAGMRALDVIAWLVIAAAGGLGIWAAAHLGRGLTPTPMPNGAVELVTTGPYRLIRHPMYTSVMAGCLGFGLLSRTPSVLGACGGLMLFFNFKARWEETRLRASFPGYTKYEEATGRFLPAAGAFRPEGML